MREYGLSLTRILPYILLIRENTGQSKPVFSHILLTKLLGQFIELHNTPLFQKLENLTEDCTVLFFLTSF